MKYDTEFPNAREGVFVPPRFATPEQIIDTVCFAESLGFNAVWGTDFITPTETYGIPDGERPDWYELMIMLAACAARTTRIGLGTGVIMAPYRDPVILAKQAATLDRVSGGRLLLGLGLGMARDEFTTVRPRLRRANRGRMLNEMIDLLRRLLGAETDVRHEGEYYAVDGVNLNPKPLQDPLPIYVPGRSEGALERIVRWDLGVTVPAGQILELRATLQPLLEEKGRSLHDVDMIAEGEILMAKTREAAIAAYPRTRHGRFRLRRQPLEAFLPGNWVGSVNEVVDKIGNLVAKGVDHFTLLHIPADTLEERRDQMQMFAEEVVPAVLGSSTPRRGHEPA